MPARWPAWLPNLITVCRILLVPVWGLLAEASRRAFVETGEHGSLKAWSVAVLLAIGVSDLVDGFLARRLGLTSRTGATLDAVADKLAQVVLLTFFTFRGEPAYATIPLWFLVLILGRDLILLVGYFVVTRRCGTVEVVHRVHGKAASLLLFTLLVCLNLGGGQNLVRVVVPLFATLVVVSTISYFRDGWRQLAAT